MIEMKVKDWKQLKQLIRLNKKLAKLARQKQVGYAKYIHTWKATLSSPNRIRVYETVRVLNEIKFKERVEGSLFKHVQMDIWKQVSRVDSYVGIIDYEHKFVFCGSKEIIQFMKKICREAEYRKNCDWQFIDATNSKEIKIDELLEF